MRVSCTQKTAWCAYLCHVEESAQRALRGQYRSQHRHLERKRAHHVGSRLLWAGVSACVCGGGGGRWTDPELAMRIQDPELHFLSGEWLTHNIHMDGPFPPLADRTVFAVEFRGFEDDERWCINAAHDTTKTPSRPSSSS